MDFITGLPRSNRGHDSIWVIIDRLTKVAHFLPVKTTDRGQNLAELYISRIVSLHGVPKRIVYDQGSQFTSRFWESLHRALGTNLSFITAFHPQTGGQTERVNEILEDMLRAYVLSYGAKWEDCLPFAAKFSYINSYQASLQMASFEALYGRKCRTPLNWAETGESQVFGPDIIKKAKEQVQLIRDRLKAAQSRQKSCRGDDLGGAPRAGQYAGRRPRSLHDFNTRRPALLEGPAAPAAGWRLRRGRPEPGDEDKASQRSSGRK
jgi:transposase InsO family protein